MLGYMMAAATAVFLVLRVGFLRWGAPETVSLIWGLFWLWAVGGPQYNGTWHLNDVNNAVFVMAVTFPVYFIGLMIHGYRRNW